jgi:hypothetical protein
VAVPGVIEAAAKAIVGSNILDERRQFLPDFGDAFTSGWDFEL